MWYKSNYDIKKVIEEFIDGLKKLQIESSLMPEANQINADSLYETAFYLGREINLNPNYKEIFTIEDIENIKRLFPSAFSLLAWLSRSLVCNMNEDDLTNAKIWLTNFTFFIHEIFNYYKLLSGDDSDQSNRLESASIQYEIEELERQVKDWSKQSDVEDYEEQIPNLDGIPQSHSWWTAENRLFSKIKYSNTDS